MITFIVYKRRNTFETRACYRSDNRRLRMSNEFIQLALTIQQRFNYDPFLELGPSDLNQMVRNHIVLEPQSRNPLDRFFFKSKLRCTLCNYASSELDQMALHCQRGSHRHNVYKAEFHISESVCAYSISNKIVLEKLEHSIQPMKPSRVLELLASARLVSDLICELCQVCVNDLDRFFLHLTGFGHTERCRRLSAKGFKYFLAYLDPESERIYLFSVTEREIVLDVDSLALLDTPWYGYSHIKQISTLNPNALREFVSVYLNS